MPIGNLITRYTNWSRMGKFVGHAAACGMPHMRSYTRRATNCPMQLRYCCMRFFFIFVIFPLFSYIYFFFVLATDDFRVF